MFFTGSIDETIPLEEKAIRLSPRDPQIGNWYELIGRVHLLRSRVDQAIIWFEKARSANPGHPNPHVYLASSYALEGEIDRAGAELTEARRLRGEGSFSSITRLRRGFWGCRGSASYTKALFSSACAKPGCRRSEAVP
jgi:tetratricopeptide (TPR) repeat protein